MNIISSLKNNGLIKEIANVLYFNCVAQSRKSELYSKVLVPDTLNGRFELIILHIMLVLRRLRNEDKNSLKISECIMALMFSDMDRNLREMGVGDLSVGKQVKKMAAAFYGRAELWEDSLNLGETALSKTLLETIFRSTNICKGEESMLARYLIKLDCALGEMPINHITSNKFSFPAVDYLKQQN